MNNKRYGVYKGQLLVSYLMARNDVEAWQKAREHFDIESCLLDVRQE